MCAVRRRPKKKFHEQICKDESPQNPIDKFKMEVFNVSLEKMIKVLEFRFTNHIGLYKNFECFHSSSFVLLPNLPKSSLQEDCAKLIKFYPELTQDNLLIKLLDFASLWNT